MKRSGLRKKDWSAGSAPYVRVADRQFWNDIYDETADELRISADYPKGVKLSEEIIDVLAFNIAYRAIWLRRNEQEGH